MDQITQLLEHFFKGKSVDTKRAYEADLMAFSEFMGMTSKEEAVSELLNLPESQANLTVMYFRTKNRNTGLTVSSSNRKVSTLRSLVKLAKVRGLIDWNLQIPNESNTYEKPKKEHNVNDIKKLFNTCRLQNNKRKAVRDYAILRLLYDLILKRNVISDLNIEDFNQSKNSIICNNSNHKASKTKFLSTITARALKDWIKVRGNHEGALFINFDAASKGKRLTSTSIYRLVTELSKRSDLFLTPDIVRQVAIKEALEKGKQLGLDEQEIIQLTDHKSIASLKRYQRSKEQSQKKLSAILSEMN